MIPLVSLFLALLLTYIGRAFDFYLDLKNYKFKVSLLLGFKLLLLTTMAFAEELFLALKNRRFQIAVEILRIFIFHYGAFRIFTVKFLKRVRETKKVDLLQLKKDSDDSEQFVEKPLESFSPLAGMVASKVFTKYLRKVIQLFEDQLQNSVSL